MSGWVGLGVCRHTEYTAVWGKERGGWEEKELRGGGNGERTSEKKCKIVQIILIQQILLEHCWSE